MFGDSFDVAAKAFERPVTRSVGVGHRFQGGKGFGGDDEKGFGRVEILDRFGKIGAIHVGDKAEGQRGRCNVSVPRRPSPAESEPPMPILMTLRIRFPVWPFQSPLRTRRKSRPSCREPHGLRHHVLTIDDDRGASRGAQSDVQNGPFFRDIDLLAPKHGVDPASQPDSSAS